MIIPYCKVLVAYTIVPFWLFQIWSETYIKKNIFCILVLNSYFNRTETSARSGLHLALLTNRLGCTNILCS